MTESVIVQNHIGNSFSDSPATDGAFVFVTGGTGLVGSHLIGELVKRGKKVRALYRSNVPNIPEGDKVEWVQGDVLDVISLDEGVANVEEVYHCAAIVSFHQEKKNEMFATNVEGTANVVNASIRAGVKKLCFVSSVSALGQPRNGEEISETANWSEEYESSNYGKSKYLAEMEVWRGVGEGLGAVIVNPSIILGTGNWNEGSTQIFKTAFEEFPWFTDGETGFVDVYDVITVMIELMERNISGERFIVSAENRKYKEIFTGIANAFGKRPPYKKVTRLMAAVVWRFYAIKSMFTGNLSILTKETAQSAQQIIKYNNSKIKQFLPSFAYSTLEATIKRVCMELSDRHHLLK